MRVVKIDGVCHSLTAHGKERFIERVGEYPEHEMIRMAMEGVPGYQFIWASDSSGYHLITVLKVPRGKKLVTIEKNGQVWTLVRRKK